MKYAQVANTEAFDTWTPAFTPCLPVYVEDTLSLPSVDVAFTMEMRGPPANTMNGAQFTSFGEADKFHSLTAGTVEEWTVDGVDHPLHVHINPMQVMVDTADGWHKAGDWVDVIVGTTPPFPVVRTRIDQFIGPVVVHCHILGELMPFLKLTCPRGAGCRPGRDFCLGMFLIFCLRVSHTLEGFRYNHVKY
jgi:hypothetical protein